MATHAKAPSAQAAAPAANSTLDMFSNRVERSGHQVALRRKQDGRWQPSTWRDWDRAAREIAGGLIAAGVAPGDRVVLLANTRQEWVECDVGIIFAGACTVPIYPSSTPEQCEYIINDCGASVVIVEDPHQLEKLLDADVRAKLDRVRRVIYMSDTGHLEKPDKRGRTSVKLDEALPPGHRDRDWASSLAALRQSGAQWLAANASALDDIRGKIGPKDVFTIVYTSGTTGPPKGVVLTHGNFVFECDALQGLLGLTPGDEQVLFLPLAHIFARILEWTSIEIGCATAFAEGVPQLISNMQEVRPTFVGAVPRVYEKAFVKIQSSFEDKRKKPISRLIIDWALAQGRKRSESQQHGETPDGFGIRMADRLVFEKVRNTFGGRLKFFISGGAPLAREIAEFFHCAGVLVLEGYGLTETTAATHLNRPDNYKFGTVGPAVPGVEVKIAADGEILVRGKNIMREYYGKPEATAEVLEQDGWFHTGDIGEIDDKGRLRITDRKKDIIVTAGGKNVAPQNLESALKAQCPYVSQVMVHGDQRKFLSALVTLNEETIAPWARDQGVAFSQPSELAKKPQVRSLIEGEIKKLNATLPSYESIKKFEILDRDFDQATGELTPTLKVKRKFVGEKYKAILDGFYANDKSAL
jgi:long-chain acyl-CoA synthetase